MLANESFEEDGIERCFLEERAGLNIDVRNHYAPGLAADYFH